MRYEGFLLYNAMNNQERATQNNKKDGYIVSLSRAYSQTGWMQ